MANATGLVDIRSGGPSAYSATQRWYRLVVLGTFLALLASVLPFARASSYRGTQEFHATIEMAGAVIALLAGTCFITRFYSLGNRFHLLVGLAFFVNGVKDFVHGLLALGECRHWMLLSESRFEQAIPATGVSGRILMALLLILAVLLPSGLGKPDSSKRETFWASSIALIATGLATWAIFLVPLPRFDFPDQVISRPLDFAAAVFFAIALALFLRMYLRTRDALVWGLALSIGISVVAQIVMGFSKHLGDACYDIAHVYKVLGYAAPILIFALYQTSTILEVKRMERLLADEKSRLSVTLRSIGDAVIATDVEGRIVLMNGVAERLTGWPERDAVCKPLSEVFQIINEKTRRPCEDPVAKVLRSGAVVGLANHTALVARDGTERSIADSAAPIHDAAGNTVGVVLVFRDVTQQRFDEDALRQSEERFRLLVNSVKDYAIFRLDPEGRVASWNLGARQINGYDAAEIVGRHFSCFYTREDRDAGKPEEELRRAVAEGRCEVEGWRVRKDGSQLWANVVIAPVYVEDGTLHGFAKVTRDITERKRMEEDIRRAHDELEVRVQERTAELAQTNVELSYAKDAAEAANRAKSTFLANMSHEIRTPLNAVIGMTELVLKTPLSAQQREFLQTVRDSGEALLSVINDILDFSKIEAGKIALDLSTFDLRESLGDTMKSFAIRAHQQGLELACFIHPEVPRMVVGDYSRLRQIIVNLVGNAIKFTEQGEVCLEVTRESHSEKDVALRFVVADTGIGIPPEKQTAIFQMFEQADASTTRHHGGTGLGLAIASRLVGIMGGRICVESEVGRGSRFSFVVRLDLADNEPPEPVSPEPASLHGMRVLVVDDSATNRRILDEVLRGWRVAPTTAPNAAEALDLLLDAWRKGEPYRLVLTDAHMPQMDGFMLAEQIKQDKSLGSTVIMMLTSGDRPEDTQHCEELGIAAYLLKPIKQSELLEAIELALGISVPKAELLAATAQPKHVGSLHILLAEDSLVNQKLAVALLEGQGHKVRVVNNGREAIAVLQTEKFDVVLMDVQMPEMDGLEATERIRAREQHGGTHLPIIAMTAHALKGDRERCLRAGMDNYIAKPIRAEELFSTIDSLFPHRKRQSVAGSAVSQDVVNWAEALKTVQGDRQTLKAMTEAALEEFPQLMTSIGQAIAGRDHAQLRFAAHTLKGAVRYFGASRVCQYAAELEDLGRKGECAGAETIFAALEGELARVTAVLAGDLRGI